MYRKTYIEINLDNISYNIKQLKQKNNKYEHLIGTLRGEAYGHGNYIVNQLIEDGMTMIAVSSLEEAADIRSYDNKIPILCTQPIDLDAVIDAVRYNVTLTIHSIEYLKALMDLNIHKNLNVHLKIDSGIHRLGFTKPEEVKNAFELLKNNDELHLEGLFTTFSHRLDYKDQLEEFAKQISLINLKKIVMIHIANIPTDLIPDFCNGVRFDLEQYGYDLLNNKNSLIKYNDLKPALAMYSEIIQIKEITTTKSGPFAKPKTISIAVLPVGYNDGIGKYSRRRIVQINNKKYDFQADFGMSMSTIHVNDNIKIDDAVLVLGKSISLSKVAKDSGLTVKEFLCQFNKKLPHVYVKNNQVVFIKEFK